jgi:hypothetical protein
VDGSGLARLFFTLAGWSVQPCVRPVSAAHKDAILAILLASAIAATFVGRRASNAVSQGRCLVRRILCGRLLRRLSSTIASVIAADRRRRRREEAPDLLRR